MLVNSVCVMLGLGPATPPKSRSTVVYKQVVLICFTCPAITVATVILRALDRVRGRALGWLGAGSPECQPHQAVLELRTSTVCGCFTVEMSVLQAPRNKFDHLCKASTVQKLAPRVSPVQVSTRRIPVSPQLSRTQCRKPCRAPRQSPSSPRASSMCDFADYLE